MLPEIEADDELLQQAFYNLVINAIKYTPDGGKITVSGRALAGGRLAPGRLLEYNTSGQGKAILRHPRELLTTETWRTLTLFSVTSVSVVESVWLRPEPR